MEIKLTEFIAFYLLVLINAYSILLLPKTNSIALIFFFRTIFCLLEYLHTVRYRKAHNFLFRSRTKFSHIIFLSLLEHTLLQKFEIEWIKIVGVLLCIFGQVIRTIAEFTLQQDFNLNIKLQKKEQKLCKTGIYRVFRHPSYTGSFYLSIGLHLILNSIFCLVLNLFVAGTFFYYRIKFEEKKLEEFYGKEYKEFKAKTWVLIPQITLGDKTAMLLDSYRLFWFKHE